MSLINEALKKAQRQRTAAEPAQPLPGGNGGPAPRKRGRALPTQTLLLIVAGAAALIVVSVVLTIFLVRSEPGTTEPTAPVTAKADAPAATVPAPVITLPKIEVPVITPEPEPVVAAPEPAVETKPAPAPEAKPVAPTPPVYDERVYAFIDRLQVMGIRSSGSDSKVLMNDRVYRVNDIVERSLGLKLMEVTADSLIFVDPSGATYTKNF